MRLEALLGIALIAVAIAVLAILAIDVSTLESPHAALLE